MKLKSNCYKHMTDSELLAVTGTTCRGSCWDELNKRDVLGFYDIRTYRTNKEVRHSWRAYEDV